MVNLPALKETAKLALRIGVFAAASAIVSWLLTSVVPTINDPVIVALLTSLLTAADKYIHENQDTDRNGLLPF